MQWIKQYQLFLFDFDGLLVNTEEIHYQAYKRMFARRGIPFNWDFNRYSAAAHHHATGLRDQMYQEYPALLKQEPEWTVLYDEKKHAFLELLQEGAAHLMPGVAILLQALQEANIPRCVVTHSAQPLIQLVRQQNPILNTIPYWITREHYSQPKPDPECYRTAIARYGMDMQSIIGFEDSPRGLHALMGTSAKAVLVCPPTYPYVTDMLAKKIPYYPSFESILDHNAP